LLPDDRAQLTLTDELTVAAFATVVVSKSQ
jgi:hypothetical protein